MAWLDATFKDTRQNVAVSGLTLLMAATDGGHEQLVDTLLRRGADPNQQESEGWTVLMIRRRGCYASTPHYALSVSLFGKQQSST